MQYSVVVENTKTKEKRDFTIERNNIWEAFYHSGLEGFFDHVSMGNPFNVFFTYSHTPEGREHVDMNILNKNIEEDESRWFITIDGNAGIGANPAGLWDN